MDHAELEAFYGTESNFAVEETEDDGARLPDGGRWAICTTWAGYVRRLEGDRAQLFGYSCDENPSAEISRLADGHDFAIVDFRWLVDPWSLLVEGLTSKAVLDLEDPDDLALAEKLNGPRRFWGRNLVLENVIDAESEPVRAAALEGIRDRTAPSVSP